MAFTQDQLDALEAAIATGTLIVHYGDKYIRYQTTADMIRARDLLRDEMAGQPPASRSSASSFCRD